MLLRLPHKSRGVRDTVRGRLGSSLLFPCFTFAVFSRTVIAPPLSPEYFFCAREVTADLPRVVSYGADASRVGKRNTHSGYVVLPDNSCFWCPPQALGYLAGRVCIFLALLLLICCPLGVDFLCC